MGRCRTLSESIPPPLMLLGRVGAGEGGGKRDALKTHTGWKMRNETTVKDKSISIYYSSSENESHVTGKLNRRFSIKRPIFYLQ